MRSLLLAFALLLPASAPVGAAVYEFPPQANSPEPPPETVAEVPAPDLVYEANAEWDWRAQTYWINFVGGNGLVEVDSPFWLPLEGLEDLDYEPEDGWVLMAKNLGSESVVVNTPFLILYNKYRGTIRFIAYIHSALHENYTWGRITLRFANASPKTKNLNKRSVQLPLNRHLYENPMAVITLQDGWNYADFQVGYDPNVSSVIQPLFAFDIDGVSVNTIALDGQGEQTTVSMGVTDAANSQFHELNTLIAGFNKGVKSFNSTAKGIEEISKYLSKFEDAEHAKRFQKVLDLLAGGKVAFPLLAGVVGFAESLFGAKRSNNQPVITKSISHLKLTGSMQAEENIATVLLRVPGANHQGQPNALPIWDYPLGLFAILSEPPTTYRTSNSAYRDIALSNPCVPCGVILEWFNYMDILHLDAPVQYAVNTSFPGALPLASIEAAWTFSVPHPKPEGRPGYWGQTPPYYIDWVSDLVDAGRYVIIGSADPLNTQFFEYRTQFVSLNQFHQFEPEVPRLFLYAEPYYSLGDGITPPVQIRARFAKPGGTPNDDIFVTANYDLWWPDTSPFGQPFGWNPGERTPVWKDPEAPVQAVLSPTPGQLIARSQPWEVRWEVERGSIDSVEVRLSADDGQTYPLRLGIQAENSGLLPVGGIGTLGSQFRVRVRTFNGPAYADAVSGAFSVWGVDDATTTASVASVCSSGSKTRLTVNWNTTVPTDGMDQLTIWTPGGTYTASTMPAGPTTSHSIVYHLPCATGTLAYQVSSSLNGAVAAGSPRTVNVTQCATCEGGGCRDCQFEQPAQPAVPAFFLRATMQGSGAAAIEFGNPVDGPVRLEVFDIRGGRVAELLHGNMAAGAHRSTWDGRGSSGERLGAGVYFVKLEAGNRVASTKLVRTR